MRNLLMRIAVAMLTLSAAFTVTFPIILHYLPDGLVGSGVSSWVSDYYTEPFAEAKYQTDKLQLFALLINISLLTASTYLTFRSMLVLISIKMDYEVRQIFAVFFFTLVFFIDLATGVSDTNSLVSMSSHMSLEYNIFVFQILIVGFEVSVAECICFFLNMLKS